MMLAAIPVPAVLYSANLYMSNPKPADLLVAMCIGLFWQCRVPVGS